MGAAIGRQLVDTGHEVLWASEGRSQDTRDRAKKHGLMERPQLAELAREAELIFSICPPEAAMRLVQDLLQVEYQGLFVDANAVSPNTARLIANIAHASGCSPIDGGIVGPPPWQAGTTRFYVSGERKADVVALFEGSNVEVVEVEGDIGAASAVKMCYAAWTKGSAALVLAIRALAQAEGVDLPLLAEWESSQPELPGRLSRAVSITPGRAWRFVGEMDEIAKAFGAANLPEGFHQASAEINRRLAGFKDQESPDLNAVLDALLTQAD